MPDYLSQRAYIVLVLAEEKGKAQPNEGVVTACEAALRAIGADLNTRCALHIEMSQPRD